MQGYLFVCLHTESSYFSPFATNVRMHKGGSPVSIGEKKMTHADRNYYIPIIIYYNIL